MALVFSISTTDWDAGSADYTVSNASELDTALSTIGTAGGATVALEDGNYGAYTINTAFTSLVTLRAVNLHGATFDRLLGSPQNVTYQDILVQLPDPGVQQEFAATAAPVSFSSPQDVTLDRCDISGEVFLRCGYGVEATDAVRFNVQNGTEIYNCGRGGVRYRGGVHSDCVINDCILHKFVGSPIGVQGSMDGLDILRNEIYDFEKRPDDPDWTDDGSNTDWESLHSSFIALRDCVNVAIEDNVCYSMSQPWIQMYAGEASLVYEYGNISVKRNLLYDVTSQGFFVQLQTSDTLKVGPFNIENNTVAGNTRATYTDGDPLQDRFPGPVLGINADAADGDTVKNNLIIGRYTPLADDKNNVVYYAPGATVNLTDNTEIIDTYSADSTWIDDQFVTGTAFLDVHVAGDVLPGYTFKPKPGSFLATAGEGGTYVGVTAP